MRQLKNSEKAMLVCQEEFPEGFNDLVPEESKEKKEEKTEKKTHEKKEKKSEKK